MGQVLGGREQVRAAVVQASPVFMNKKGCLEKACDLIHKAGKEGAEIVVFPETWIPTYPYWGMGWDTAAAAFADVHADLQDNSLVVGSKDTDILGKAARDAGAVAAHWTENGEYFADDGTTYRGRMAIEKAYQELFGKKKTKTEAE
ncbi:MAG: hypothetical protein HW396_1221, partial [Candidatus Dadabacteria bacterium]|nr:hypothetical protein [Candidatus Dadabacteria bacterium]